MRDNILKLQDALKKYNIKMWLIINKDNNDEIFCRYISKNLYTKSFLFVLQNKCILLIDSQDKNNKDIKELVKCGVKVYVYESQYEMLDTIEEIICSTDYIGKIALSYSTLLDKDADIMLHSDIVKYTGILRKIYKKYHKQVRFCSSEKIIYYFLSQNSKKRLERIRLASKITDEIIEQTMRNICVNMSEIEIANLVIANMHNISKKYINDDLIKTDVAWDNCPFVLIGKNLSLNGHTPPSDLVLKRGDTLSIDFGIKAIFSDGKSVYSDMQRMGYALNVNESTPPDKVKEVFCTLRDSIDDALDYMKPDVKGYAIDEKIRNKIVKSGYPNYFHASGHPVGLRVHSIGTIISSKLEPRAKIGLVESGVYTLEPRIAAQNGGSIEEMVEVTKYGGVPVYKLQKELYIIK